MIIESVIESAHLKSSKRFVHGGPYPLRGDSLKRHGRSGHDMGALFFSELSDSGIKYSIGYAISRSPKSWALYIVKINIPDDQIFDFTKRSHREIAKKYLSRGQYNSWETAAGTGSHLSWTSVDDELFEEMGFRASYFQERPPGVISSDPIISIGVFNAGDVKIEEVVPSDEVKRRFPHIFNNS